MAAWKAEFFQVGATFAERSSEREGGPSLRISSGSAQAVSLFDRVADPVEGLSQIEILRNVCQGVVNTLHIGRRHRQPIAANRQHLQRHRAAAW